MGLSSVKTLDAKELNSFMKFIPVIFLAIDILFGLGISFFFKSEFHSHILIQRSKPTGTYEFNILRN